MDERFDMEMGEAYHEAGARPSLVGVGVETSRGGVAASDSSAACSCRTSSMYIACLRERKPERPCMRMSERRWR